MSDLKTYTVEQVAKMLKIRKNYVYDLIYSGKLRALRLSERRFRITESALLDFLRQEEKQHIEVIKKYQ